MSSLNRRGFLRGAVLLGTGAVVGVEQRRVIGLAVAFANEPLPISSYETWGAAAPTSPVQVLNRRPSKIVIHHTASPNTADPSEAHAFALARSIQRDHFDRGYIDSGQQFTVSRGGWLLEGRHRSLAALTDGTTHVRGAHCEGQNDVAIGIENEGNYSVEAPPAALYDRLVSMCAYICGQYSISAAEIHGHRDFNSTDCPGDALYRLLPKLRMDVARRSGGPVGGHSWPTVSLGDSGERVRTVQYLLRARSYVVASDGVFGSSTRAAVEKFQVSFGLSRDGIVGAVTWESLVTTIRSGARGDAVLAVQSQLAGRGYTVTRDGAFGPGTESAVRDFQTVSLLVVDGTVGIDTWNRLVS